MNLEEYKNIAVQRLNKSIAFDKKEKMYYACMGLIEETGEIVAELRKPLFKGNFHEKSLDIEEIKSELGDLIWYISLICKNSDIDMGQIIIHSEEDEKLLKLPLRENLIQRGINLGRTSGQVVEKYQNLCNDGNGKQQLIEKISEQFKNIESLANQLNITIDEILNENLRKISSRYDEKGEATR